MLDKILNSVEKVISVIIYFSLCALVLIVTYIAFMRYVFSNAPQWGESLALLLMVWFCLLSSALGVKNKIHIRMTIMDTVFSKKTIEKLEHLTNILWFILGLLAIVIGIRLTMLAHRNIITGLSIPSSIIYFSIPVFGLVVMLSSLNEEMKLCKRQ